MNTSNKRSVGHKPQDAILGINSDFAVVEAYKNIRTNIMYSMPQTSATQNKEGKVIVVTSPSAGEGKTTTCINIAITFAQLDKRILLIDCDLRKPKIHKYLQLDSMFRNNKNAEDDKNKNLRNGISEVLCGFDSLDSVIKQSVRTNLDVITAGGTPPNPVELLQSVEFTKCIKVLKNVYDYIIIDTPPISVVTDAVAVSKLSDGVVLLVKKEYSTYDLVDVALEKLNKAEANILGAVMIDSKDGSYFGGGYKYGYKYRAYTTERKRK